MPLTIGPNPTLLTFRENACKYVFTIAIIHPHAEVKCWRFIIH